MKLILIFLQVFIGYNLVLPLVLYVIYSIKKRLSFYRSEGRSVQDVQPVEKESFIWDLEGQYDYGIIVTAYEETALLPSVIGSILKLNYNNYLIYIVADKCDTSHLIFNNEKVIILKPETVLANNIKSHFYAIKHFRRKHNVLTIIDSDNIVDADYLNELNSFFNQGFKAIQGMRAAKKTNSTIARLDGIRDIYYHFYDGKLLFELGSSATLCGSGMAFKTDLYKDCLERMEINGAGFDKVLQAQIVEKDERIAFADQAVVYDEKTSHSQQLVKQRSRWINTWFKYFSFGFDIIILGLINRSINQFLFGLILLRPPLFIFISLSFSCLVISLGLNSTFSYFWVLAFISFLVSFYIPLRQSKATSIVYRSLLGIPKFMFFQFLSLLFVKSANKRSVATKHHTNIYERKVENG